MIKIKAKYEFFRPRFEDETQNPFWENISLANSRGVFVQKANGYGFLEIEDYEEMSIQDFQNIKAIGGEITGFPYWIIIEDINQPLPTYLQSFKDETFKDVMDRETIDPIIIENSYYFPDILVQNSNDYLIQLITDGYNVIDTKGIKKLLENG